ncbi:PTS sugar transporter subunit IIA [Rhizohabitans arisaemae]|uniref:PTS sugar transporter subunit IIA n=1 Tax=Rhizohabitans arisaemae TaxID=2720610 RepID=UPI0024B05F58|nr:PTS glucose transporter subunit IIA [Rhizohabitans arisaemae]
MLAVLAPVSGEVIGLGAVPDPAFAEGVVGPGTAIDPTRLPGEAVSPLGGRIAKLHPHAFVVVGPGGRGVLVHLGIDTVDLRGEGFRLLAAEGDRVRAGQPIVAWNPAAVVASGFSPVCPIVALDVGRDRLTRMVDSGRVDKGDEIFQWR